MKDIRKRLKEVLATYNVALSSIAVDAAMQTRLSRQVNMGSSITFDTLYRFLEVFQDVSSEWLMRGTGKMLLEDNLPPFHGEETERELELHAELARKVAELEEYKLRVLRLEAQKDYLQQRNDELVISNRLLQDELSNHQ